MLPGVQPIVDWFAALLRSPLAGLRGAWPASVDRFERSFFYSDSINDLPLLEAVTDPVAVRPDDALRARAVAAHWPVLDI